MFYDNLAAGKATLDEVKTILYDSGKLDLNDEYCCIFDVACRNNNNIDIIKFLLQHQANPYSISRNFRYCFTAAAEAGHIDIIKLFIEFGIPVDPPQLTDNDTFAIKHARSYGSPLMGACVTGRMDVFDYLVEHGADINFETYYNNRTPLHAALQYKQYDIYIKLLGLGADLSHHTRCPSIPCMLSSLPVQYMHNYYIYGGKLDINDDLGYSPLYYACSKYNYDVLQFIVEHYYNKDDISQLYNMMCDTQVRHILEPYL